MRTVAKGQPLISLSGFPLIGKVFEKSKKLARDDKMAKVLRAMFLFLSQGTLFH